LPRPVSKLFLTIVLAARCCLLLVAVRAAQVSAQIAPTATSQQPGGCQVVKKKHNCKGKPETSPCTTVLVTVPAPPPPPPPEDPCKVGGHGIWAWLKCNHDPVSALAAMVSGSSAVVIGLLAYFLNRNVRKGQVAQEQMRMLLEIDNELIERPELWAVHGPKYLPAPITKEKLNELLEQFRQGDSTGKIAAAEAIVTALSDTPHASRAADLQKLAFLTRYLNFFDILYGYYGKKSGVRRFIERERSDWRVWQSYIKDFFRDNVYAVGMWKEVDGVEDKEKIYSVAFSKFLNKIIQEVNPKPASGSGVGTVPPASDPGNVGG
jgi:hypothetical protein